MPHQQLLVSMATAILVGSSESLFIKVERYDSLDHSSCGPRNGYTSINLIGCVDNGKDIGAGIGAPQTIPFTCDEGSNPYDPGHHWWDYTNVTRGKDGIFSVTSGRCKEKTCTDSSQCSITSNIRLANGNRPGDILSGSNCTGGKSAGVFNRYSIVSGNTPRQMKENPPANTGLLKKCTSHRVPTGGVCSDTYQMFQVNKCQGVSKKEDKTMSICKPAEKAMFTEIWSADKSDKCSGTAPYVEKYYEDEKSCYEGQALGYHLEFCNSE